jgi:hypothetical protein
MRRVVFVVLLGISAAGNAQAASLADVKAQGAVQLSADELKQLMTAAKVVNRTNTGNTRRWENKADGTFIASSDNAATARTPSTGHGTWRVADNGTFCVDIQWQMTPEKWCRYFFKAGDKYYGFFKLEDSAPASEFELSK